MFIVFVIGTAEAGKSLLTASFTNWLKAQKQDGVIVNLNPGAFVLPYTPDIDIREYIHVEDIMEKYGLGQYGALRARIIPPRLTVATMFQTTMSGLSACMHRRVRAYYSFVFIVSM